MKFDLVICSTEPCEPLYCVQRTIFELTSVITRKVPNKASTAFPSPRCGERASVEKWRIKRRERVTSTSTSRTQSLTIGHAIFNNLRKVPFFRLIFEISILESCIISLSFNSRSFLIVEDCVPNCQRLSKIAFPIAKD